MLGKSPRGLRFGPVGTHLGGEGWYPKKSKSYDNLTKPVVLSIVATIDKTASTIGNSELKLPCVACNYVIGEVHYCLVTCHKGSAEYKPEGKAKGKDTSRKSHLKKKVTYGNYSFVTRVILCNLHRINLIRGKPLTSGEYKLMLMEISKKRRYPIVKIEHSNFRIKSRKLS